MPYVVDDVLVFYLHVQRFTTVYSLWFQKAAKGSKPQKLNLAALSGNEDEVKRLLSKGVGKCKIAFCWIWALLNFFCISLDPYYYISVHTRFHCISFQNIRFWLDDSNSINPSAKKEKKRKERAAIWKHSQKSKETAWSGTNLVII